MRGKRNRRGLIKYTDRQMDRLVDEYNRKEKNKKIEREGRYGKESGPREI